MTCPECIKENKKSIVYEGVMISTLLYIPTVYDENGKIMDSPINNTLTIHYTCSNGHSFQEKR